MPRFPVKPHKEADLTKRMRALKLFDCDFEETFYKVESSSGKRATSVGVSIIHRETSIHVKAQKSPQRSLNRFIARRLLVEELEARKLGMTRDEMIEAMKKKALAKSERRQGDDNEELPVEHMYRMFHRSMRSISGEGKPF